MPDVETVLETCFIELSKEYDIEEVDSIPRFEKKYELTFGKFRYLHWYWIKPKM